MPEGPPPATPPRVTSPESILPAPPPASPISPPPAPPSYGQSWDKGCSGQKGDKASEEPSRLVHQLPLLDIKESRYDASVTTGDWLARIAPVMRSLSPNAPSWWSLVTQTATGYYNRWLHADPLQKLSIKWEAIEAKMDFGPLARVEERASILILQALPVDLQSEAVSIRGLASSALIFLVMSRYQPGGSSEKSMMLSYLTQPYVEGTSNVLSHHGALRKWDRLYRRGQELGLQSPDPILLVRALDALGKIIHNKSPTAAFTVATFRHQYQLDSAPTEASVLQYCQLLIAELETISLSGPDQKQQRVAALSLETPPKTPKGQGKGDKGNSSKTERSSGSPLNEEGVCKFFMSAGGCRYGKSCIHYHSPLAPSDSRCFNCGAEGHTMSQCERPTAKAVPEGVPKLPSGGKGDSKGGKGNPKTDSRTQPVSDPKAKAEAKPKKQPKGRRLGGPEALRTAEESGEPGGEGPLESILKSLSVEGPYLTASLRGIALDSKTGLLDGGATHCLRFGPPGEYEDARPVEVQLASGSTQELRINAVGTLISPNPGIQPIMPMGLLATELKCDIRWDESACEVRHPSHGRLNVTMVKNCPEVEASLCLDLIQEVEARRASAMIRSTREVSAVGDSALDWDRLDDDKFLASLDRWVRNHYGEVPERVLKKLVPKETYEAADSGLNRHARRRLERGSAFVHLFSGEQRWDHGGSPSIALDLKKGHDLKKDSLYFYLLRLARKGAIQYLLGGPPCRTFTPLRGRGSGMESDGGPRIVRGRNGPSRFGLPDLTKEEWEQVDCDSLLALRLMILADVCSEGLKVSSRRHPAREEQKLFFGFEHPEDPAEFLQPPEKGEWPSIWTWVEVRDFVARHNLFEACFHQGLLEHCKVKPTRMMLSSGHLWERLHMLKVPRGGLWKPTESAWLRQRIKDSSAWATWAPQLVDYIKQSMHEWKKGVQHAAYEDAKRQFRLQQLTTAEGEPSEGNPVCCVRKLKGSEMEQFRRHCLAGHRPWRADCKACLDAMSFSRPHRRMQKSRACSLSIDVSGPFKVDKAEDYEVNKPKYMLVGAYTFPVFASLEGKTEPLEAKIPTPEEASELLRDGEVDARPASAADQGRHAPSDPMSKDRGSHEPLGHCHAPSDPIPGDRGSHEPLGQCHDEHLCDLHEEVSPIRDLTSTEKKRLEAENKRWEGIISSCKDTGYELVEVPFAAVLPSKSTQAIIGGLNRFYSKLRSLGLPVYRLHSDCAQEFTHPSLRQWANHRGIHVTTTMPESKASNGRAERLIGRLKQQARALLSHHQLAAAFWPHALRYSIEVMQRSSLAKLGHPTQPVAPFYSLVKFRSRSWRNTAWGTRVTEGRLMTPCHDISKGYVIRVVDKEIVRFYATTLIYKDFQAPEPPPDLTASETLAHELHTPRSDVGWPPPVHAGDIQVQDPLSADEAPLREPYSDDPPPVARRRITSKTTPTISKVSEALPPVSQQPVLSKLASAFVALPLAELQSHAMMMSKASLNGLNRDRTHNLLEAYLQFHAANATLHVSPQVPVEGIEQLVHSVVVQCCPHLTHYQAIVTRGDASHLRHVLAQHAERELFLVPLSRCAGLLQLWLALNRGSVLRGDISVRPDGMSGSNVYGQTLTLAPWHVCVVDKSSACCVTRVDGGSECDMDACVYLLCWSLPPVLSGLGLDRDGVHAGPSWGESLSVSLPLWSQPSVSILKKSSLLRPMQE